MSKHYFFCSCEVFAANVLPTPGGVARIKVGWRFLIVLLLFLDGVLSFSLTWHFAGLVLGIFLVSRYG